MKFLVIGCGSIGQRHIRNLKKVKSSQIDVFDLQPKLLQNICKKFRVNPVSKTAIKKIVYDCVFICTTPNSHVYYARDAIRCGSNIFIEKPVSSSLKEAKFLLSFCRKKNSLAFVGYNLRFNKSICFIKNFLNTKKLGKPIHVSAYFGSYLPDWRPDQNYTENYIVKTNLGGGIVLDGSHELDYLRFLFGNPFFVQSNLKRTKILKSETEALADVILEFDKDLLGTIHLDYLRRYYKRTLEILFENGIIEWSLSKSEIKIFNAKSKRWKVIRFKKSLNEMYQNELEHVIKCIKSKKQSPTINLKNGVETLEISELIKKSHRKGKPLGSR